MKNTVLVLSLLASTVAVAGVNKGQKAPDFQLPSMKGGTLSLSSLKGKVVLLDFWASWCEPCKKELPELQKLSQSYAGKDVVVVGVNIDDDSANAQRLAKQLGVTFDVALDKSKSAANAYDPPKMPSSFVIDKKGVVQYVNAGFDGPQDVAKFKQEIDALSK
jgi:peroxiredoxin